jgi:hypothetical protein
MAIVVFNHDAFGSDDSRSPMNYRKVSRQTNGSAALDEGWLRTSTRHPLSAKPSSLVARGKRSLINVTLYADEHFVFGHPRLHKEE